MEASYQDADGDSGAPVFTFYGNGYSASSFVKLVGIHRGGFTDPPYASVFSEWAWGVQADLGAMDPTLAPTLSAPVLSGAMMLTYPQFSWPSVSGATTYHIFRAINGVLESAGTTTSTSYSEATNVLEYTGSTPPPSGQKIQYYIYASTASQISPKSNVIWYRGANGTFSVSINGPSVVGPYNRDCSVWIANVTGAAAPITYQWSGLFSGTDYFVQGTVPTSGGQLQVVVRDVQDRIGGYILNVAYDANNQDLCQ